MQTTLLKGQPLAKDILSKLAKKIAELKKTHLRSPALAVIQVGADSASSIYVNHKIKACEKVGITSFAHRLADTITEHELLSLIDELNDNVDVDGILVQLPLPFHIDKQAIIERIHPEKDVDGFHPYNLGRLAAGKPLLRPCTPYGIVQLLEHYTIPVKGRHVVVIGASTIVGRPMALEFLLLGATVTVCHSATRDLSKHVKLADLLVVATGQYNVVDVAWLNSSQTVIDVGMHREPDGRLHGDIDFQAASQHVAAITPVPLGVGPMTICALLQNTVRIYELTLT